MRTAIVGDIGGQIEVFYDVIESLGGNKETGIFPPDLRVIQVGDIVRFNESDELDSLACAELADKLMRVNDGRYIQLFGNHETPLLGGALHPHWKTRTLPESQPIIKNWWDAHRAYIGVALVKEDEKDIVITHAGLTAGYMSTKLKTDNPREAVRILNSYVGNGSILDIEQTGGLIDGVINPNVDTFWSLAGAELYDGWWDSTLEFNQIHGHSCTYDWEIDKYWWDVSQRLIDNTSINFKDRFVVTTLPNGNWFRTVDWVLLNTKKRQQWPVFILDGWDIVL